MTRPWILGLTGGIGSGKSTVAALFAELGVPVVDADQVARELVAPGTPALAAIQQHFGGDILLADGTLDRAALRQRIFHDQAAKQWLEQLLHPRIREALILACQQAVGPYVILMAPLLLENGLQSLVQRVLSVDVSVDTQIARTCRRDQNDPALVQRIIASQIARADRLAASDDVLNNENGDLSALRAQVKVLHSNYLQDAAQHRS